MSAAPRRAPSGASTGERLATAVCVVSVNGRRVIDVLLHLNRYYSTCADVNGGPIFKGELCAAAAV